jgi:RNA polymerase sigma factor (sigma-70 family)
MAGTLPDLVSRLPRLLDAAALRALTDAQLVERFAEHRDESAFALLMDRHGRAVLGAARQVLGDRHAAEDVFQATFLVLARKAGTFRVGQSVCGWLYTTAVHLARTARTAAARRQAHERRAAREPMTEPPPSLTPDEFRAVLHEEVSRLPENYRLPVLLCHLEGLTHDEAAAQLGWPVGTVRSRLSRARDRLRVRLERRGVTLAALAVGTLTGTVAEAVVPASLAGATVRGAVSFAAKAGPVPAEVTAGALALAKGALRGGAVHLKVLTTVLVLGLAVAGAVAVDDAQVAVAADDVQAGNRVETASAEEGPTPDQATAAPVPEVEEEVTVTPVMTGRYVPPPECVNLDWLETLPPPDIHTKKHPPDGAVMGTTLAVRNGQLWAYLSMWVGARPTSEVPGGGALNYRERERGYVVYQPPPGYAVAGLGKKQEPGNIVCWGHPTRGIVKLTKHNFADDLNEYAAGGTRWDRIKDGFSPLVRDFHATGGPNAPGGPSPVGVHLTFHPVRIILRGPPSGATRRAAAAPVPGVVEEVAVTPVLGRRYVPPPEHINLTDPGGDESLAYAWDVRLAVPDGRLWAYLSLYVTRGSARIPPRERREHGFVVYQPPPGCVVAALGKGQGSTEGGPHYFTPRFEGDLGEHLTRGINARLRSNEGRVPAQFRDRPEFRAYRLLLSHVEVTGEPGTRAEEQRLGMRVTFNPVRVVVRGPPHP